MEFTSFSVTRRRRFATRGSHKFARLGSEFLKLNKRYEKRLRAVRFRFMQMRRVRERRVPRADQMARQLWQSGEIRGR